MPEVTVVIPAYNAAASIGDALESVFDQDFPDLEVIVVDDGSTDGTSDVVAAFGERVKLVRQSNGGPGRARNAGIRAARGRLIAFLDADDVWLPGKLPRQVEYFSRYPWTGLLHTAAWVVGDLQEAAALRARAGSNGSAPRGFADPPFAAFCDIFHTRVDVNTLTVMAPRAIIEEAGGFDESRDVHVEDWDLWLRIAARWPIGYIDEPLAVHVRGGSMSGDFERTIRGQRLVIERHLPACRQHCATSPRRATRCRAERLHRLQWELGYLRMERGDTRGAASAFRSALAHRFTLNALSHYAGCRLPRPLLSFLRREDGAGGPVRVPARSLRSQPAIRPRLAQDTRYRAARRKVARLVHRADDFVAARVRSSSRRRILFEAASPLSVVVFLPVLRELRKDPRLELLFTVSGSAWTLENVFPRFGITEGLVPNERARWMKVDLVVNTDFFEMTWLYRRTRRVHLFHGVAGKYGLDAPTEHVPEIRTFDRILFPNEDRARRYFGAGLVGPGDGVAVLCGYPKVDSLVNGSLDRTAIELSMGIHGGPPIVIYAPTWSPYSSLGSMGEEVIEELARAGFMVLVKLHDRSYDLTARGSGGTDWARRLRRFDDNPSVRIIRDPDSAPYLFVADALVTDHSSIGFEYMLLDRPIVVIDCPALVRRARINPEKVEALRSAADVVGSAGEVASAVAGALAEPDRHGHERRRLARTFFHAPGSATARAVDTVYRLLELEAPLPVEAEAPLMEKTVV